MELGALGVLVVAGDEEVLVIEGLVLGTPDGEAVAVWLDLEAGHFADALGPAVAMWGEEVGGWVNDHLLVVGQPGRLLSNHTSIKAPNTNTINPPTHPPTHLLIGRVDLSLGGVQRPRKDGAVVGGVVHSPTHVPLNPGLEGVELAVIGKWVGWLDRRERGGSNALL